MRTLLMIAALALAGCQSHTEALQRVAIADDQQCRSYGAEPGTDAYVNCRVNLRTSREQAGARQNAAVQQAGLAMIYGQQRTSFTCSRMGTFTQCY